MNSVTCPKCLRTSHNPNDIKHLFCGICGFWDEIPNTVRIDLSGKDVLKKIDKFCKIIKLQWLNND